VIEKLSAKKSNEDTAITAETLAKHQMQQQILNMANSSQQNQQMLDQMTALATTVSTLQTQLNNNNQDQGNRRRRGRGRDNVPDAAALPVFSNTAGPKATVPTAAPTANQKPTVT
jgi:hypothetical protein